jgi:hypothetical protein
MSLFQNVKIKEKKNRNINDSQFEEFIKKTVVYKIINDDITIEKYKYSLENDRDQ